YSVLNSTSFITMCRVVALSLNTYYWHPHSGSSPHSLSGFSFCQVLKDRRFFCAGSNGFDARSWRADAQEGGTTLDGHGGASRLGVVARRGGIADLRQGAGGDRQRGRADLFGAGRRRDFARGEHHA